MKTTATRALLLLAALLIINGCLIAAANSSRRSARIITNINNNYKKHDMSSAQSINPALAMNWNMYEISTRPWLYNLSKKYNQNITRISQVPFSEFEAIRAKGFDIVWLMGVWSLGQYGLNIDRTNEDLLQSYSQVLPDWTEEDVIGSPYAVTEYVINPELGTEQDFQKLRTQLNAIGLKLMLDFVPNHSAVDAPWTTTNPQYYVLAPKGSQPPYDSNTYLPNGIAYGSAGWGGSWIDTAQFNYWNPDTVAARMKQLNYVASMADGIRCDMAYLLLNDLIEQNWGQQLASWGYSRPSQEFWEVAIPAAKKVNPNVIFLAEVYDPYQATLQSLGFDYTYDKDLYDRLTNGNLDNIRQWLSSNSVQYFRQSAHFVANHDEQQAVANFGSPERANAAAAVTFTVPGMRFHWKGDFSGATTRLLVQLRRRAEEPKNNQTEAFYKILMNITTADVFNYGTWTYLNVGGSDQAWTLLAWMWRYNDEKRLCVINYSTEVGSGAIVLPNAEPGPNGQDMIPVTDLMTNTVYMRSAQTMRTTGLFVVIQPWTAQIFEY
eukprot:GEZU01011991.1.p1 GENE.GEZU01011991.1~~GEZU01011991.1.p1  ORF type:complete len:549 (-),score=165.91 GEZU01011991.1:326-1972(-)